MSINSRQRKNGKLRLLGAWKYLQAQHNAALASEDYDRDAAVLWALLIIGKANSDIPAVDFVYQLAPA